MDDKRVADYFVVAGLLENPEPLEDAAKDDSNPKSTQPLVPITDIAVIIRSQGETPPAEYTCIELTPWGFPADLNHGSLRSPNIHLCYRRGRDKPPLVDIGVLYEGKERVMADSEVILTTPSGRSANVNNSGSRTYLTYRRAPDNAPCNQLVVTDICVILANKNEHPPRAFCLIEKNLNKGMLGSDVYICYKKSMNRPDMLCYKPGILSRFPLENYENFELPSSVAVFCLPMGATVECWPKSAAFPKPLFSTFVLTSDIAQKVYGAAMIFYEKFPEEKLTDEMKKQLNYFTEDHKRTKDVYTNKSVCILSRWPFYDTFEKFLRYLHRMSISGPHKVPLERVISHFMLEIPFPSPQRPRILIQLNDCTISLAQPEDTPLPLSGASYIQFLKSLGPDNCLKVLFYVLMEQKILFHSLRPDVLTSVAEAVVHLIFPLHWQCPYIPLCPLGLSDVLCAPVPFIVGVDSRYFDLYDPPHDVTCIDLDTNSIFLHEEKRSLNVKLLPKRPARILRNRLQTLYAKLATLRQNVPSKATSVNTAALVDYDFKAKRKERQLELEIQEAFLRFLASLLKGYRQFLKPITTAPTIGTTDPNSLFDLQGFLRSRDRTYSRFYVYMMKTQMFIRFIEERSFVSDKDAGLAFFDECTEKVDLNDYADVHLLETEDAHSSERTVFIAPPEPIGLPPGVEYTYSEFGTLKPHLYHRHPAKSLLSSSSALSSSIPNSPMARRTKQEIKSAQKIARKQAETPVMWARCLVGYCFTLWFIHLPSFVKLSPSKSSALRIAFDVLVRMQLSKLSTPEEVCYRVLMLLCGLYSQPTLAVKVLFEMKRNGIQPNAITYGYYNKAVLESKWPSANSGGSLMWNKVRNVIMGVAQFRQGLKKKARRSLSLSSDIDYDRISRTSTESSNPEDVTHLKITHSEFGLDVAKLSDDRSSSGGQSDCGYSSLNQDEGLKMSPAPQSRNCEENSGDSDRATGGSPENKFPLNSELVDKSNSDMQNEKQANKLGHSRSLKFSDIDFSASDAFRSRVGSIVKSSATSLVRLQDLPVDSAAGILMTSQSSLLEDSSFCHNDIESRRRHRSAGDHCCHRIYHQKARHCSGPLAKGVEVCDTPVPFLRSYSFGNDFQIIRKIREAKEGLDKNGFVTKLFDSPLKRSFSLDKKQDGKADGKKAFGLSQCPEESEVDLDVTCNLDQDLSKLFDRSRSPSIQRQTEKIKDNTSLFAETLNSSENSAACASHDSSENLSNGNVKSLEQEKDFISNKFTPLKEAWMNLDLFSSGALPRMASSISNSLGFNQGKDYERSPGSRKVTRSSTFHGGSRAMIKTKSKSSDLNDMDVKDEEKSSTLPVGTRSKSIAGNKLPGVPSSGWAFPVSTSSFGISRLTSRHSEVLDSLKSAVTSVSTKINEFKSSLSATNTPTKGNLNPGVDPRYLDGIGCCGDESVCKLSTDGNYINTFYLHCSNRTEDVTRRSMRRESSCGKHDPKNCIPHVGSAPAFSTQVYEMFEKNCDTESEKSSTQKVAMEINMTTCSRCMSCSSLLYDEEIMEGWCADDSNLNTQCTFCKARMVPSLTIGLKDFRWEGSHENLITPACSAESVKSAPVGLCQPSLKSTNNPSKSQENRSLAKTGSIDSTNEAFILLESSPVNEENSQDSLATAVEKLEEAAEGMERPRASSVPEDTFSRDSVSSSVEDNEIFGSVPSTSSTNKLSQHSQSTHSSADFPKAASNGQNIESVTVPYLSPLVLRKELENVLEHEGDNCMTKPEFVDQHPIIFWNLVWFFQRIRLPSHLSSLVLQAQSVTKGKQIPSIWQKCDFRNVVIHCAWDNLKLHEDMGPPMYMLWALQQNAEQSSLVHALLTEETKASKSLMKQVLAKLQCNDLFAPICMLLNERRKCSSSRKHHHSIYREILFLSFVAVGREAIDNLTFDVEYRKAYEKLSDRQLSQMKANDRPPSEGAVFCRQYFRDLELKTR